MREKKTTTMKKKGTNQTSITLPIELNRKLELITGSLPSPNKSKVITQILKQFFDKEEYFESFLELNANEMLIPVSLYKKVEDITDIGLKGQIERGDIKIITLGVSEYVQVNENSWKNTYLMLAQLKEQMKETSKNLVGIYEQNNMLEDKIDTYEKRILALEKSLKKS